MSEETTTPPAEEQIELQAEEEEEEEEQFSVEGAFAALGETLSAISATLSRLAGDEEEEMGAEDGEELSASERHIMELRGQVNALQDENTRMELSAAGITENVDEYVELKRVNPTIFAFSVEQAKSRKPRTQQAIGSPGTAAVATVSTSAEILELARQKGEDKRGGLAVWVSKNYPSADIEEVINLARSRD